MGMLRGEKYYPGYMGASAINVGTVFRFSRIFFLVCHAIPDLNEKPHQTLGLKGRRKKLSADVTVKYTWKGFHNYRYRLNARVGISLADLYVVKQAQLIWFHHSRLKIKDSGGIVWKIIPSISWIYKSQATATV